MWKHLLLIFLFMTAINGDCDDDTTDDPDYEIEGEVEEEDPYDSLLKTTDDIKIEVLPGDKKGSKWLLVNSHHFCHLKFKNDNSGIHLWEWKLRRFQKCPFKISTSTSIEMGGAHQIEWSYNPNLHSCFQDPIDAYKQKFRNAIKNEMSNNFRAKYSDVYAVEKRKVLKEIDDVDLRERVRHQLPSEQGFRSSAYNSRRLPKAPVTLDDIYQ